MVPLACMSWMISSMSFILLTGCVLPDKQVKAKYHSTVGLKSVSLKEIYNHQPVKTEVRIQETGELIEIIVHRDDKRGK